MIENSSAEMNKDWNLSRINKTNNKDKKYEWILFENISKQCIFLVSK